MEKRCLFQEFPRSLLEVTGPDRVAFLHNMLTHDIKGLIPGQGRPACLLTRQGKIEAAMVVHAFKEKLLLAADPLHREPLLQGLKSYLISEKVEFHDVTDSFQVISLHGPGARELLTRSFLEISLPEENLRHSEGKGEEGLSWVSRLDLLALPGFHLWVDPKKKGDIFSRIRAAGGPFNLQELSPKGFEELQIEAGIPWPGKEITRDTLLNELWNYEEMVSFTKGCYVGQEIVARIKYRAHPPRLLTGFTLEGSIVPLEKSPIMLNAKEVGVITSACFSPTLNRPIALGFLAFGLAEKIFSIQTTEGTILAEATPLPFV